MLVEGDYALEVHTGGEILGCDARSIKEGRQRKSGLARYCNDNVKGNNVMFAPKSQRVHTWGIRVLPGKVLLPGEEIFVSYGKTFWEKYKTKEHKGEESLQDSNNHNAQVY